VFFIYVLYNYAVVIYIFDRCCCCCCKLTSKHQFATIRFPKLVFSSHFASGQSQTSTHITKLNDNDNALIYSKHLAILKGDALSSSLTDACSSGQGQSFSPSYLYRGMGWQPIHRMCRPTMMHRLYLCTTSQS